MKSRQQKQKEAEERQKAHNLLTIEEKLIKLSNNGNIHCAEAKILAQSLMNG